jgi:hypothetical protein
MPDRAQLTNLRRPTGSGGAADEAPPRAPADRLVRRAVPADTLARILAPRSAARRSKRYETS